jgi:hypothetical protein
MAYFPTLMSSVGVGRSALAHRCSAIADQAVSTRCVHVTDCHRDQRAACIAHCVMFLVV